MKKNIAWFIMSMALVCCMFSCNLLLTSMDCSMGVAGGQNHCSLEVER